MHENYVNLTETTTKLPSVWKLLPVANLQSVNTKENSSEIKLINSIFFYKKTEYSKTILPKLFFR
jgi:hypothetical protein